jgi:hypothetical protein
LLCDHLFPLLFRQLALGCLVELSVVLGAFVKGDLLLGQVIWELFLNQVGGESWPGGEETSVDGFHPGGWDRIACCLVQTFDDGAFVSQFADVVGCVVERGCSLFERNLPKTGEPVALSLHDDDFVLQILDTLSREAGFKVVVAKLTD